MQKESLYEIVKNKFRLWRCTPDMIIVRTHEYINDKRISIIGFHKQAHYCMCEYRDEKGVSQLFHVKGCHKMLTKLSDGQRKPTYVYTGQCLKKSMPSCV